MPDIPERFIQDYVDSLLGVAQKMSADSLLRAALLLRAEHAMDLVEAWRESQSRSTKKT